MDENQTDTWFDWLQAIQENIEDDDYLLKAALFCRKQCVTKRYLPPDLPPPLWGNKRLARGRPPVDDEDDSDLSDSEDESDANSAVVAEIVIKPTPNTDRTHQWRYLEIHYICAFAESLSLKAINLIRGSRDWAKAADLLKNAYEVTQKCLVSMDVWFAIILEEDVETEVLDCHHRETVLELISVVTFLRDCLQERRDEAIAAMQRRKDTLIKMLTPKWKSRDEAKHVMAQIGKPWEGNPDAKHQYAKQREAAEKELKEVNAALAVIEPLLLISGLL